MEGQINVINFVFEDLESRRNLTSYVDELGPHRFIPSAMVGSIKNQRIYSTLENLFDMNAELEHCIIPTGVGESPSMWAGTNYYKDNIRESLFDYLSEETISRIKNKKALLLLDQCLEGYQTPWLWQFLHEECSRLEIDPSAVVYVTGNLIADEQYQMWAKDRVRGSKLKIIPYAHFERDIQMNAENEGIMPTFDSNRQYKRSKIIKTYNCLNKRPRTHRNWFYIELFKHNMLDYGLVSMNDYGTHVSRLEDRFVDPVLMKEARKRLPLLVYNRANNEENDLYYINRITDQVFLDTWVTVISEASFADSDETIFISEKTFKPIACMHPFIFLGNRGSLAKLREMGYKTFDGFIDESYDNMSTFDRMAAIIREVKRIHAIEDKVQWLDSMRDILEHNFNVLHNSKLRPNPAHTELFNYYNEYFNIKD